MAYGRVTPDQSQVRLPAMTLLFTHEACFAHDPGRIHPEHPARLKSVLLAWEDQAFAALERRVATDRELVRGGTDGAPGTRAH